MVMVDVVETALDVPFDDPLVRRIGPIRSGRRLGRADRVPDMLQSVATRPFGTKPVRDGQEARLEDRLQHLQDSGLNDPVPDRRHTQRPELARFSAFGDHHAPDRCRLIRRIAEHRPRISQEAFDPVAALDGPHGHPVRTRRACPAIARDAPPRHPEVTGVGDPVPHVPVGAVRFGPTPPVEFALNVEKPCLVGLINGVHRFLSPSCTSPHKSWSPSPCGRLSRPRTTTGPLPPGTVMARLRRCAARAGGWRPCRGSGVPIENPWTVRRSALPQSALPDGHDERPTVMPLSRHAQTGFGSRSGSRAIHPRCLVRDGVRLGAEASDTDFVSSPWILR
jgi:hypothetical protein